MREILFRGKTDKGEWVQGSLIKRKIGCFIVDENNRCALKNATEYLFDFESKLVIPETIGQYTGLTDENGNKIFEGDIIRISERGKVVNGKIIFKNAYNGGWLVADKTEQSSCSLAMRNNVEVIGNIHDNPELLKESK